MQCRNPQPVEALKFVLPIQPNGGAAKVRMAIRKRFNLLIIKHLKESE
jgi:hypothetical protein